MNVDAFGRGEKAGLPGVPPGHAACGAGRPLEMSDGEYRLVLQKMFHTFAFDIREFVVEYLGASEESFILCLPGLTYFQTKIYEMDLLTERALRAGREVPCGRLRALGTELAQELRANGVAFDGVEAALLNTVEYLVNEGTFQAKVGERVTEEEIFRQLDFKTSDLEALLRLGAGITKVVPTPEEFAIFRAVVRVREVFDDIRDVSEDKENHGFNTVLYLDLVSGKDESRRKIEQFLSQEYAAIEVLIGKEPPATRERFKPFEERWKREKDHYVAYLHLT